MGGDLGEFTCGKRWASLRGNADPNDARYATLTAPNGILDARWPDLTGACAPAPATERRAQAGKRQKANIQTQTPTTNTDARPQRAKDDGDRHRARRCQHKLQT